MKTPQKKQQNFPTNKIEKILNNLHIKYTKQKLDKNDILYIIKLDSPFKEINQLNVLLSPIYERKGLLVICPNIYKLKPEDSTLSVLSALNNTNAKLAVGTVTLEDDGTVIYRRIERFYNIDSITRIKLVNIFNDIIASIIYTAKEIEDTRK